MYILKQLFFSISVKSGRIIVNYFGRSKRTLSNFLGSTTKLKSSAWGLFDLKFYRLTKINGKAENYAISTQQ